MSKVPVQGFSKYDSKCSGKQTWPRPKFRIRLIYSSRWLSKASDEASMIEVLWCFLATTQSQLRQTWMILVPSNYPKSKPTVFVSPLLVGIVKNSLNNAFWFEHLSTYLNPDTIFFIAWYTLLQSNMASWDPDQFMEVHSWKKRGTIAEWFPWSCDWLLDGTHIVPIIHILG